MTMVDSDQAQEVSSWIHEEERCITTQSVAWTFGVSRKEGSELLKRCCQESKSYVVTTIGAREEEVDGVEQTGTLTTAFCKE